MSDADVAALAQAAGLMTSWRFATGGPRTVAPEDLRRLLAAMGYPAESRADIAASRERLRESHRSPPLITADVGAPIALPAGLAAQVSQLVLANGDVREIRPNDGQIPAMDAPGYHRLRTDEAEITIAVAPRTGFAVSDAAAGKLWGVGVQLYSLRDCGAPDFGDFGALARFAAAIGEMGAAAVAVSPTHALFAADPSRFSPYAPSTRLFTNPLYADPRSLFPDAPPDAGPPPSDLVDWSVAWPARLERLKTIFERFRQTTGPLRAAFAAFRKRGGSDLEGHAVFEAIHQQVFNQTGARGWPDWPVEFQDHRSAAVTAFAKAHAETVEFHVFLQWLAERGLEKAQADAKAAGMPIGLIADWAVGMDPGGSHAWSRPDDLLRGVNIGAPPDEWIPSGQDWGITGFSPTALRATGFEAFLATIRAAARHAGGLRIDHVMGLQRLWLVPQGESAEHGAYLRYPFEDLMRLLALESWRHRVVVVGEDLGTVPDGFRETFQARGMMGLQVLWFERLKHGGFRAPRRWSKHAAALTSTHDLPTVAGWWRGGDIDWNEALGRKSAYPTPAKARSARAKERRRLWQACVEAGVADGPAPDAEDVGRAVDAAVGFVAETACPIAILQAEDLAGLTEQPNIPGTIDEHPNWRRRLAATDELLSDPAVRRRIAVLNQARPRFAP